jgi:DNA-binding helix-hairpin-helix protein with protein kinase domain
VSLGVEPARKLGSGGEADVFEVAGRPTLAYKRYRTATPERLAKLRVMVASPPDGIDAGGHVAIAWPTEVVPGGFLMPRIDLASTVPLFQVYNPASRVQIAPGFSWRYLLRTARNVAAIVDSLHRAGYVIGDINESNLLVNKRALAVLVDCDSMQVRDPATGTVHRGGVGKPEFTAPELQGRDLSEVDRTPESDDFALAVLVFQLLAEGVHPFAGIWRGGGDPPDVPTRMRRGAFPYRRGSRVAPPPHALPLSVLPPEVRRLVRRAFTIGVRRPAARPTAADWVAALERAEGELATCDRSPDHVFAAHLGRRCPWCARIDAGLPDPFPGATGRSSLSPRPPSRAVRARRAVATWSASLARAAAARASGLVRGAARWTWSLASPPLRGLVPLLLALGLTLWTVPVPSAAALLAATLRFREPLSTAGVGNPSQNGWWVGVRWTLVAALAVVHVVHGTTWWPFQ